MKRRFHRSPILFLLFILLVWASAPVYCLAAEKIITVHGTITNPLNEPVPGATVMFVSQEDTISTTSDAGGFYSVHLNIIETDIEDNGQPQKFTLHQNYPNPFNPGTTISYDLTKQARVALDIYSVTGQLIRHLRDGYDLAGSYRLYWDGRDDAGNGVAAGVYLYRLKADSFEQSRKMVLMDGGGGEAYQSSGIHGTTAKVAEDAIKCFTIIVKKAGYLDLSDEICIHFENDNLITKDITLAWKSVSTINTDAYTLVPVLKGGAGYPGGGGVVILSMTPKDSFDGEIHLAVEADSLFHAQLTLDTLSKEQMVSEIVFYPDSSIALYPDIHGEMIVHYPLSVFSFHAGVIDTFFVLLVLREPHPIVDEIKSLIEKEMNKYFVWLEANHPEYGISPGQDWFAYDLCPGCTGGTGWSFINQSWDIVFERGGFELYDTIYIRRRNTLKPIFSAQKESDGSIHEIPVTK